MGVTYLLLVILISIVPIKWVSDYVEAERTGYGWCLLALILASMSVQAGLVLTSYGDVLGVFLAAVAFSLVLGMTYMHGLLAAVLQAVCQLVVHGVIWMLFLEPQGM